MSITKLAPLNRGQIVRDSHITEIQDYLDRFNVANVKAWGARGDDSADDTSSIQAAIDALPT